MNPGSETVANLALKAVKQLAERTHVLEKTQSELVQAINQTVSHMQAQQAQGAEILNALVALAGDEKVAETMKSNRKAAKEKQAENERTEIDSAVAQGILRPEDTVTDRSVIVCRETDKDGNEIEAWARFQLPQSVKPEFLGKFVGKKVGESFQVTDAGNLMHVVASYSVHQPPAASAAETSKEEAK